MKQGGAHAVPLPARRSRCCGRGTVSRVALAHVEPNAVRRTYNHAKDLADRPVMMQRWADLLDEWEKTAREGRNGIPSGA